MRSTLDRLISWIGLALAAVLLVAGGMLTWASSFINSNVEQQLTDQDITMPVEAAMEGLSQVDKDALMPFAGQQMTTGAAARAYADHFILAHMNESSEGKTYSQVSAAQGKECKANPDSADCKKLTGLKTSLFQGSTLRGLLLYGYAFGTMGLIAGYAAIGAYVGAALFLILALLGFRNAKRVETAETASTAPSATP